jgi:hypothetical protein
MGFKLAEIQTEANVKGLPTEGILMFSGRPKSGKTRLLASIPESVVIELEKGGADRVNIKRRVNEVNGIAEFDEAMQDVIGNDSIKTVSIDTIDQLALWHIEDLHLNEKPRAGFDSRAAWGEFSNRMHTLVDNMKTCGKLIVIAAHSKPAEKNSDGQIIAPAGIAIPGKSGNYFAAHADAIGSVGVRVVGGAAEHYVTFKAASEAADWRSRIDELHDKEFKLKKEDPWGSFVTAAFGAPAKVAAKNITLIKSKGGKK